MEKFGKGTPVVWGGRGEAGKIEESFTDDVVRRIGGEEYRRRASDEDPAYLIERSDGARVMKSHSELMSILGDDGDGHVPPASVALAARKGLALREKLKRAGTTVGVAFARELQNRKPLPDTAIRQMVRFFARHEADKRSEHWGEDESPSADYVAWLLRGGDPGREWAERRLAQIDED